MLLDQINLMRWAEIHNLAERFLLTIDNIGTLSDAHLGETGYSSNNVLRIVNKELSQTDRTSMDILIRDEGHDASLDCLGKAHGDVTVGRVVVSSDVGHSD
jgi:hypothetical protein